MHNPPAPELRLCALIPLLGRRRPESVRHPAHAAAESAWATVRSCSTPTGRR